MMIDTCQRICIAFLRPLLPVSEKGQASSNQRAADMFTGLENHSVLYVLHQSTRLAALDQQEVLNLLHKSPLQNNPGKSQYFFKNIWRKF